MGDFHGAEYGTYNMYKFSWDIYFDFPKPLGEVFAIYSLLFVHSVLAPGGLRCVIARFLRQEEYYWWLSNRSTRSIKFTPFGTVAAFAGLSPEPRAHPGKHYCFSRSVSWPLRRIAPVPYRFKSKIQHDGFSDPPRRTRGIFAFFTVMC